MNTLIIFIFQLIDLLINIIKNPSLEDITKIANIFLVIFTSIQIRIFLKEYKNKNAPKVIPYTKVINEYIDENEKDNIPKTSFLLVLKLYNQSSVVAQNIQIIIDENWLNLLKPINSNFYRHLNELKKYKDLYITNKQEYSYSIGIIGKKEFQPIFKKPLNIDIIYYNKKMDKILKIETYTINMKSLGGRLSHPSEKTRNKCREIMELDRLNKNIDTINSTIKKIHSYQYQNYV
ncbi:MAG: hypothetical protein Q7K36_07330 [Fusobacterium sp. JB020]|nr:hypothetical protein [Fusobacterium sp. JB020]